jgi:hypothetical protein
MFYAQILDFLHLCDLPWQKITYKDKLRLYELSDVLNEINSVMSMPKYAAVFAYFNTSVGIKPVIQKLPVGIQNKWRDRAILYKKQSNTVKPLHTLAYS